jgi:hypothetical protein
LAITRLHQRAHGRRLLQPQAKGQHGQRAQGLEFQYLAHRIAVRHHLDAFDALRGERACVDLDRHVERVVGEARAEHLPRVGEAQRCVAQVLPSHPGPLHGAQGVAAGGIVRGAHTRRHERQHHHQGTSLRVHAPPLFLMKPRCGS